MTTSSVSRYSKVVAAVLSMITAITIVAAVRSPRAKPFHAVVIVDRSRSVVDPCLGLLEAVGALRSQMWALRSASITGLATGTPSSALEAIDLQLPNVPTKDANLLRGKENDNERIAAYSADVSKACTAMERTDHSPVYLALRRAVELSQAMGSPGDKRVVWAVTDLQELAEPELASALSGRKVSRLPSPINNAGVTVIICGYSSTVGAERASGKVLTNPRVDRQVDRLIAVWRNVFADQSLVAFVPYCKNGISRAT